MRYLTMAVMRWLCRVFSSHLLSMDTWYVYLQCYYRFFIHEQSSFKTSNVLHDIFISVKGFFFIKTSQCSTIWKAPRASICWCLPNMKRQKLIRRGIKPSSTYQLSATIWIIHCKMSLRVCGDVAALIKAKYFELCVMTNFFTENVTQPLHRSTRSRPRITKCEASVLSHDWKFIKMNSSN